VELLPAHSPLDTSDDYVPMTDGEEMVGEEEQAQAGAGASVGGSGGGRGVGGRLGAARPEPRTLRARLITAATNFSLTAYATLTVAVTKLLHCVWVPGTPLHTRHLFIQGTTACAYTGWQAPYVIVLCVLVVLPALAVDPNAQRPCTNPAGPPSPVPHRGGDQRCAQRGWAWTTLAQRRQCARGRFP
jgi:hypothetical protein